VIWWHISLHLLVLRLYANLNTVVWAYNIRVEIHEQFPNDFTGKVTPDMWQKQSVLEPSNTAW